jgi:hypothetical protein
MPMPQQQAPQEQPAQGAQDPKATLGQLVNNVGNGLNVIAELMSKTKGAPPEAAQKMNECMQSFQEALQIMSGEGQAPAQPGTVSPEAGTNPNARPV